MEHLGNTSPIKEAKIKKFWESLSALHNFKATKIKLFQQYKVVMIYTILSMVVLCTCINFFLLNLKISDKAKNMLCKFQVYILVSVR